MLKPHQYKYMGPNFSCTSEPSEKIFLKHSSPPLQNKSGSMFSLCVSSYPSLPSLSQAS